MNEAVKEVPRAEKVHLNKPLIGWAIVCGLSIGIGIGAEVPALALGGLIVAGYGLDLADVYESGRNIRQKGFYE
jgi:hypothetical protein